MVLPQAGILTSFQAARERRPYLGGVVTSIVLMGGSIWAIMTGIESGERLSIAVGAVISIASMIAIAVCARKYQQRKATAPGASLARDLVPFALGSLAVGIILASGFVIEPTLGGEAAGVAIALVIAPLGVLVAMQPWRCPSCGRYRAAVRVCTELIGTHERVETRQRRILVREGANPYTDKVAYNFSVPTTVRVEDSVWRKRFRCRFCAHEWAVDRASRRQT